MQPPNCYSVVVPKRWLRRLNFLKNALLPIISKMEPIRNAAPKKRIPRVTLFIVVCLFTKFNLLGGARDEHGAIVERLPDKMYKVRNPFYLQKTKLRYEVRWQLWPFKFQAENFVSLQKACNKMYIFLVCDVTQIFPTFWNHCNFKWRKTVPLLPLIPLTIKKCY